MTNQANGTLPRAEKGVLAPPPSLDGVLGQVADAVTGWPGINATTHWQFFDPTIIDGVDFYLGEAELGHLHLDGSIHLATAPELGRRLIDERAAKPFRYQDGWVEAQVSRIGPQAAIALFRRNYDALRADVGAGSISAE